MACDLLNVTAYSVNEIASAGNARAEADGLRLKNAPVTVMLYGGAVFFFKEASAAWI